MKPLLLGEAPSKTGDRYHRFPLSGRVARTLCQLAGVPPQAEGSTYGRWTWALYERFACLNVFERYAEATPWSAPAARGRVADHLDEERPRIVVCLGRNVQAAVYGSLGLLRIEDGIVPYYEWRWGRAEHGRVDVVAVPHPSGLNRLLNDPAERERCGSTLREALERGGTTDGP